MSIFGNLIHGPATIIHTLNTATMDVFQSVFRLLVLPKPGLAANELKQNKQLAPAVVDIFRSIQRHSRPEIISILENLPGIRALLRDHNLELPRPLSLLTLSQKVEKLFKFYNKERNQILQEIKGAS